MTPTSEQSHILDLLLRTTDNIIIRALAGTGKTSTLGLIEAATPTKPVLCLAFNKKIAEEMAERFSSTTTVRTMNSFGHRIWAKACATDLSLDPDKTKNILRSKIDDLPRYERRAASDEFWEIIHAVALAKSLGYIPDGIYPSARRLINWSGLSAALEEEPSELAAQLIDEVLAASIKAAYAGSIDFNDQVYMPALFGGTFPRFPLVLLDEFQDFSPTNHAMLDKLNGSRLVAVGDPWQSIYGFRGAMPNGMALAQTRFNMTQADLSVSFRCPRAIVENARWRVPHFKWIKEGGTVGTVSDLDTSNSPVVLCRNNAPLFRLALSLLARGTGVSVSGSDIGPRLIGQMNKLGPEELTQAETLSAIDSWLNEKLARQSKTAQDTADCMRVFAEHGGCLANATAYAESLFAQQGKIRLMTGHKAKGLEFDLVYHIQPELIREDEQDLNLRYVIQTRAREAYYEVQ